MKTDSGAKNGPSTAIPLLETIGKEGRVWGDLCAQYGVENPDPPWRVTLESTCEMLNAENCALPLLERRGEEDELSDKMYSDVPHPERQLLALAHSMIQRGLVDEDELRYKMKQVHERLTSV